MRFLRRELAPVLPEAWEAIEEEARTILKQELVGRQVVDFKGPVGWDVSALNLGTVRILNEQSGHLAVREVQPFIEVRIPIRLEIMALDALSRGSAQPDLAPVARAAVEAAAIENEVILTGLETAGCKGLKTATPHKPVTLSRNPASLPESIVRGLRILKDHGIGGPFTLALGAETYDAMLAATTDGYPVARHIQKELIGGQVHRVQRFQGALLISTRGGDFELTVGQDLSVGYANRDDHTVELYLAESFAFRAIEPAAAVYMTTER